MNTPNENSGDSETIIGKDRESADRVRDRDRETDEGR